MRVILSHPTSNEFNRAAAMGLLNSGILTEFHTGMASFPGSLLDRIGGFKPFLDIRRRRFDPLLRPVTRTRPWLEVTRKLALKGGLLDLVQNGSGKFSVDAVYQDLDKVVSLRLGPAGKNSFDAVYAYEDGALFSFRKAHQYNVKCYYDLPIGYWRTARYLLQRELESRPEWASTITNFDDSDEKLAFKDEELRLADRIFVASSFTAGTLKDFPGKLAPVTVVPYGFPTVTSDKENRSVHGRPLKLLFVGGLSQRKGIANLFAAVENMKSHVTLTLVGHKPTNDCEALNKALARHKWIPSLPHEEILRLMKLHDVLVFPSLFEGFGLVITEAMSQGTPVITTERTAGADLITHGENGWLVQAGSTQGLQECIEELKRQPQQIIAAGKAALETARKRPWEKYGQELAAELLRDFQHSN